MNFITKMVAVSSLAAFCVGARPAAPKTVTVLAAISLREVLTDVAPAFEKANDAKIEFVFGASGQLAAQAKAGSPGDLFISAAAKQVDELIAAGVADGSTRVIVARNTLVLVVSTNAPSVIVNFEDLAKANRVAVGEPKSVPAGMYAGQVLKHLHLDTPLADKLVFGANVKQVADYVARGEADAGLIRLVRTTDGGKSWETLPLGRSLAAARCESRLHNAHDRRLLRHQDRPVRQRGIRRTARCLGSGGSRPLRPAWARVRRGTCECPPFRSGAGSGRDRARGARDGDHRLPISA